MDRPVRLEYQMIVALALDAVIGDPRWFPHPVKFLGWMALWLEKKSRKRIKNEVAAGAITVLGVVFVTTGAVFLTVIAARALGPVVGDVISIFLLYTTIAMKDLIRHSRDVYLALKQGRLGEARGKASLMVGRRTEQLDEPEVVRATVESVAENMVDGVAAPLFYGFIAGPVGAMVYKAINTLDSLFGYKEEPYTRFGKFAARLDDVANFLPARISASLVPLGAVMLGYDWSRAIRILIRDRRRHDSPNSGWPEAAFAGALGVRLGGRNLYGSVVTVKPHLGDPMVPLKPSHILQANRLMVCSILVFVALAFGLNLWLRSCLQ